LSPENKGQFLGEFCHSKEVFDGAYTEKPGIFWRL